MYHNDNNNGWMIIYMYFVGIDDAVHGTIDQNSEGEKEGRSSVYDGPGKWCFILIGYKNCT